MRTTVSLSESNSAYCEQRGDDEQSDADKIRDAVDRARRLEGRERALAVDTRKRIESNQSRIDELETELQRVKDEKRAIIAQREENKELAKFAADERSKRERLAAAGILTSIKWRVTGVPGDDDE